MRSVNPKSKFHHLIFSVMGFLLLVSTAHAVEFEMKITVSAPDPEADDGKAGITLVAGGNSEATYGFDPLFDVPALFFENAFLKAAFPRPDLSSEVDPLWRDIRKDNFSWTFDVSSRQDGTPVTLLWSKSVQSIGCEGVEFTLTQEATGQVIDMEVATNYTFNSKGGIQNTFLLKAKLKQGNPPGIPGELWSPRIGKSGVLLTWSISTGENDIGYRVMRRQGGGSFAELVTTPLSTNKYLDRNVIRGETYTYHVIAVSSGGCKSIPSENLTLTIP